MSQVSESAAIDPNDLPKIGLDSFLTALKLFVPCVTDDDLCRYLEFRMERQSVLC